MKMILASGSPRRRELLRMITEEFEVRVSDCEEKITKSVPSEVTEELSLQKAEAVLAEVLAEQSVETPELSGQSNKKKNLKGQELLIIGDDTVVSIGGEILGKPANQEEARKMISSLQGRSHEVYTGVSLCYQTAAGCQKTSFSVCTKVFVAEMAEEEIEAYISTEEPYDKAGGYGIQGIFGKYVEGIEGDYNNVVGLPVQRLYQEILAIKSYHICRRN